MTATEQSMADAKSLRIDYLTEVARELFAHCAQLHPALPPTSPFNGFGDGICRSIAVGNALKALDCLALGSEKPYSDIAMTVLMQEGYEARAKAQSAD